MTPEKQRATIAEACGWKCSTDVKEEDKIHAIMCWIAPKADPWQTCQLPDYLNSLDDMHKAEKEIIARNKMNGFNGYENTLCGIIDNGNCVHATASQKAEAFLKTLDLWE